MVDASPTHCSLVTSAAAGRLDAGEVREVEIGNGFERFGYGAVAQAARQCREPVGILSL